MVIRMKMIQSQLHASDLTAVKAAFTTRRVKFQDKLTLLNGSICPQPGDLTLAQVIKIGHHSRIELRDGRRSRLFKGDRVCVCYGNRYAPDQFEAVVPERLEISHLAAAGGIIARILSRHQKMKKPTVLKPLGILGDERGRAINLADFAMPHISLSTPKPLTIGVMGTAMNAGKTTTAAYLIHGLVKAGLKVGAAKLTGTGAGGDIWFMKDAGADPVFDFIDAGFASTYKITLNELQQIIDILLAQLTLAGAEAIVLEFSDGLYQDEITDMLCTSAFNHKMCAPLISNIIDGLIFAAHDAMGAHAGIELLTGKGLPVLALSGVLTQSPLAIREAQEVTGLPVMDAQTLCSAEIHGMVKNLLAHYSKASLLVA